MEFKSIVLSCVSVSAPITYLGLIVYCLWYAWSLNELKDNQTQRTRGRINIIKFIRKGFENNLRSWGFIGGWIIFGIFLILDSIGLNKFSLIDIVDDNWFWWLIIGFFLGVSFLEFSRIPEDKVILSALYVMAVVAGSLISIDGFAKFGDSRWAIVLATLSFLLGVVLDYILRKGMRIIKKDKLSPPHTVNK
jgi:hypothetical protein